LAFDLSMKSHGFWAAEHIHLIQEEPFEVTRDTRRLRIQGKDADAAVGQRVVVPAGTAYSWWNASDEEAELQQGQQ
jgi:hypothetical protein